MIREALILTLAGLSSFTAAANQTASITLTWTPSSSTNVAGYDIYYGTVSSNFTSSLTVSNVSQVTIPGLTNGTTYYFAVRTFSSSGYLSMFSPQISDVASTPAIPATITSQLGSPSGQFSFSVSGTIGDLYAVEASTNLVNWVIVGTNTAPFNFVDTNASQFCRRFYRAVYDPGTNVNSSSTTPSPAIAQLTSTFMNAAGQYSFTVTGTTGDPYAVEASTNLMNWVILGTNTAPFNFVDTNASQFSRRFYRAVYEPGININSSLTTPSPGAGQITSASAKVAGQFSFTVTGTTGDLYAVEASTNLVNWVILGTNTAPFNFVDTNASQFSRRFYRAVYEPGTNAASSSTTTTAQTAGQLTSASLKTAGQFSFTVTGTTGDPYAVEASTNLVNWTILTTNTVPFNFVDTNASQFSRRFYRAVPAQYAAATSTATTPPSPAPAITASSVNSAGHFSFTVSGISGYRYAVEASTNLVNWTILQANVAPFNFEDKNSANFSRRFYRAVYFPN